MQYMGGKSRVAKELAVYLENHRQNLPYLEPFVGAGWILVSMTGNRSASDVCPDLIALYKALQLGWKPPISLSETEYKTLRHAEPSALRAFAGFGCSFAGKWFGGYARNSRGDNYALAARNSLLAKVPKLVGVEFSIANYVDLMPSGRLIYCDPPYSGTTSYSSTGTFDWVEFWQVMRRWSENNRVYISEYEAPDDFECVWAKETYTEMRTSSGRAPRIERLFRSKARGIW